MEKEFLAGASKIKITPPLGTRINGDFYPHYAIYIHDELYVKALILKNYRQHLVFIVVDICTMGIDFLNHIKSEITRYTGIISENILISSTHTHAAGAAEEVYLGGADLDYRKKLPLMILDSVLVALTQLKPAKITTGSVDVPGHVLCRRYFMKDGYQPKNPVSGHTDVIKTNPLDLETYIDRPVSTPDSQLSFLGIKGTDDTWIAVLANYSLHYVGDWENGTITADYYGFFANHLNKLLNAGPHFVAMMSNGTSGDINIWDFQHQLQYPDQYFAKSENIGCDLAEKLFSCMKEEWNYDPDLCVKYELINLTIRKPSEAELEKARATFINAIFEHGTYTDEDLRNIYSREQILLNESDDQRSCPLQVFKIGQLIVGALPGEFFAETGLWLKNNHTSGQYFTIGLANGNIGYVPPPAQFELGGYETWRSRYSCLPTDAERIIRTKLKSLIDDINN